MATTRTEKPSPNGSSWTLGDGSWINVPVDPSSEDIRKSAETFWASHRHGFHGNIGTLPVLPKSPNGSHHTPKK